MSGQAEQRQDRAAFPETTETRLKDVFAVYEKLERELLQHIAKLRLEGWLEAESAYVAEPAEHESPDYDEDNVGTRYLLR